MNSLSRRRLPLATLTNGANTLAFAGVTNAITDQGIKNTTSTAATSMTTKRKSLVQQPTKASIHVGHAHSTSLYPHHGSSTTTSLSSTVGINGHSYATQPALDTTEDESEEFFHGTTNDHNNGANRINGIQYEQQEEVLTTTPSLSSPQEETKTQFESDLVVVLDMDECLIHSQFFQQNINNKSYRQQEADRDDQPNTFAHDDYEPTSLIPTSACESFQLNLPDGDLVQVHKRPNLDLFLRTITSRYETHVFTAAMEVYASPLLDVLDPDGTMFQSRFYREDCTLDPKLGVYVKDLSKAFTKREMNNSLYDEQRAVLVDNNPFSFLANPSNGILVSNFYDDPKDDTLHAVMELLHELEHVEDVRTVLTDKFGLEDALKEIVQNPSSLNGWR